MCSWHQQVAGGLDEPEHGGVELQGEGCGGARNGHHKGPKAPPEDSAHPRPSKLLCRGPWSRAFLQVLDRLIDDVPIDPALLVGIAEEEAVIADGVDESWNSTGIGRDSIHRRVGEQTQIARACNAESSADVGASLFQGHRWDLAAQPEHLLWLLPRGQIEAGL